MSNLSLFYEASERFSNLARKASERGSYFELISGGLGDVILHIAHTPIFQKMDAGEEVVVTIMTCNSRAWEVIGFHPYAGRSAVLMIPYWEYRGTSDENVRKKYGLPENPKFRYGHTYGFFPHPPKEDLDRIEGLRGLTAAFSVTASGGPSDIRSIPKGIVESMLDVVRQNGLTPVFLGSVYKFLDDGKRHPGFHIEGEAPEDVPSMIGKLTVPGSAEVVRRSVVSIACDSAMSCVARVMKHPQFRPTRDALVDTMKLQNEGHGTIFYPDHYVCSFKSYREEILDSFIKAILKKRAAK